jgi:tryptophan-rich sensory protein
VSIVWVALAITLAIEVPIVAAFYKGQRARLALAAVLANLATNLAMNMVIVRGSRAAYDETLLVGEAVALLLEAAVYAAVDRKHDLVKGFTASGAANLASFSAGLVVFGHHGG